MITRRLLLLGAAAVLSAGCAHGPRASDAPALSTFVRALPGQTVTGEPFDKRALEGRVVLITFLATWCFPCLADLVTAQRLERDWGPAGFSSVLVGMDLEGPMVLEPFAENARLTAPLLAADDQLRSGETPFGRVRELPTRLLFGRDGVLVTGFSGVAGYEALERLVASELSRPAR